MMTKIYSGTYGAFHLECMHDNDKNIYYLDINVKKQLNYYENYCSSPQSIQFRLDKDKEYDYIRVAKASLDNEELPKTLIKCAYKYICTDSHDFLLLTTEIAEKSYKRGIKYIQNQFKQLINITS